MIGWLATEVIELDGEYVLLEVALVLTDRNLVPLEGGSLSLAVLPSPEIQDRMRRRDLPAHLLKFLSRSGLIDDCVRGGMGLVEVDRAMGDMISARGGEGVRPVAQYADAVVNSLRPLPRLRRGLVGNPIDLDHLRSTMIEMGYDPDTYQTWDRPLRPMRILRSQIAEVAHINAWAMQELESPAFDVLW